MVRPDERLQKVTKSFASLELLEIYDTFMLKMLPDIVSTFKQKFPWSEQLQKATKSLISCKWLVCVKVSLSQSKRIHLFVVVVPFGGNRFHMN